MKDDVMAVWIDGMMIVPVESKGGIYHWVLPGGKFTRDWWEVKRYTDWILKHNLHWAGRNRLRDE
jgi:hypothetical protein